MWHILGTFVVLHPVVIREPSLLIMMTDECCLKIRIKGVHVVGAFEIST